MHIGQGYGHDGDGCTIAEQMLLESPVVSEVWFDKPNQRLAQKNPNLYRAGWTPRLHPFDGASPTRVEGAKSIRLVQF